MLMAMQVKPKGIVRACPTRWLEMKIKLCLRGLPPETPNLPLHTCKQGGLIRGTLRVDCQGLEQVSKGHDPSHLPNAVRLNPTMWTTRGVFKLGARLTYGVLCHPYPMSGVIPVRPVLAVVSAPLRFD